MSKNLGVAFLNVLSIYIIFYLFYFLYLPCDFLFIWGDANQSNTRLLNVVKYNKRPMMDLNRSPDL